MFGGYKFLRQTVLNGIFEGVVFSRDKIHCLDPSKQPRALANLWMLATLASQIHNAKLRLRLRSALEFFSLALLGQKLGQMPLVIFQGPDNLILFRKLPWEFRVLFDDFIERSQNSGDSVVWSADVLLVARR